MLSSLKSSDGNNFNNTITLLYSHRSVLEMLLQGEQTT